MIDKVLLEAAEAGVNWVSAELVKVASNNHNASAAAWDRIKADPVYRATVKKERDFKLAVAKYKRSALV